MGNGDNSMEQLEYGKRYDLERVDDLKRYQMSDKQRDEAIETLNKKLEEDPDIKIYFSLAGSEHNYKWLQGQLEEIIRTRNGVMSAYDKQPDKDDEYVTRYNRVIENYDKSIKNINLTLSEYERYFKEYGTYDIIIFSLIKE